MAIKRKPRGVSDSVDDSPIEMPSTGRDVPSGSYRISQDEYYGITYEDQELPVGDWYDSFGHDVWLTNVSNIDDDSYIEVTYDEFCEIQERNAFDKMLRSGLEAQTAQAVRVIVNQYDESGRISTEGLEEAFAEITKDNLNLGIKEISITVEYLRERFPVRTSSPYLGIHLESLHKKYRSIVATQRCKALGVVPHPSIASLTNKEIVQQFVSLERELAGDPFFEFRILLDARYQETKNEIQHRKVEMELKASLEIDDARGAVAAGSDDNHLRATEKVPVEGDEFIGKPRLTVDQFIMVMFTIGGSRLKGIDKKKVAEGLSALTGNSAKQFRKRLSAVLLTEESGIKKLSQQPDLYNKDVEKVCIVLIKMGLTDEARRLRENSGV